MVGQTVGNYRIIETLGEGGMGTVFRGIDMMLEREVAVKMLRPQLTNQPNVIERFRSEAVTLARLNHPNIALLYSFIRQDSDYFMIMEYVRGETLESMIRRKGALPVDQAVTIFCDALVGIEHAHQSGIVHRDIKPANIMVSENGTVKVMDFGIARVLGTSRMTRTGHLIGTIEYMSPEQVRGEETDARSDIYALGILLYEMLTGNIPFTSTSDFALMRAHVEEEPAPLRSFLPNIAPELEQVILKALEKGPENRFASAAAFREALEPYRSSEASAALSTLPVVPATATAAEADPVDLIRETRLANGTSAQEAKETRLAGAVAPTASGSLDLLKKIPPVTQWPPMYYVGATAVVLLVLVVGLAVARFSGDTPVVAQNEPTTQTPSASDTRVGSGSVTTSPLTTPSSGNPSSQVQSATRNPEQISAWLGVARKYFGENRLTTPPDDNALAYCDRVLAVDPQNAEATRIKAQIAQRYADWGDAQMQQGNPAKAREYYQQSLDVVSPNQAVSGKLASAENQLAQQQQAATPRTTPPRQDPVTPPVTQPSTPEPTVSEPITKTPEEETTRPAPGPARTVRLRSNTEVVVALTQALRSDQNYAPNQTIQLRVTKDVVVDGVVVIPRNSPAFAEIREAKAGEGREKGVIDFKINVVQAADGSQIPLKSATFKEVADRGENIRYDSGQAFIVRIARTTELTIR